MCQHGSKSVICIFSFHMPNNPILQLWIEELWYYHTDDKFAKKWEKKGACLYRKISRSRGKATSLSKCSSGFLEKTKKLSSGELTCTESSLLYGAEQGFNPDFSYFQIVLGDTDSH